MMPSVSRRSWWGRISDLEAFQLQQATAEYEQLQERSGRAMTYAYLYWATATHDPERGALLQYVRETCTKIGQVLLFFGLEWVKVDDEQAQALMKEATLAGYRHFLECERLFKDHTSVRTRGESSCGNTGDRKICMDALFHRNH